LIHRQNKIGRSVCDHLLGLPVGLPVAEPRTFGGNLISSSSETVKILTLSSTLWHRLFNGFGDGNSLRSTEVLPDLILGKFSSDDRRNIDDPS